MEFYVKKHIDDGGENSVNVIQELKEELARKDEEMAAEIARKDEENAALREELVKLKLALQKH